ncbi:hypothetical protein CBA19CS22_39570 [Caballeronia novacaledonica]|uniref:Uncharacterized protein n=1 Tax=Caballeronia novacaledonica TaxID=1544861 RepID=A0ACB5R6P4_9BURK|nr:hypothetical protein CBA19CS22_39570 [Caballeronia novacaledonica]
MLPNVSRGWSFKGLTRYLINPKRDQPEDTERVGFIHLENFLPDEARTPEEAAHTMAMTWKHADRLKREAGVAATGQKVKSPPVWHCSLSWTEGEKPTREEMLEAGRECLAAVGLALDDGHHTYFIEHRDTKQAHMHIVVNLVHPIDGRQINPVAEQRRSQRWANRYDRARGHIFCPQRYAKYSALEKGLKLKSAWGKATRATKNRAELEGRKLTKYGQRVKDEAAAIKTTYAERVKAMQAQNAAEYLARKTAKETLWQTYQQQRQVIKDQYQAVIRDYYLHRRYKEVRAMRPKGPTHLRQSPEWRGLNRRLRTEKAEFFKREMAPVGWDKGQRAWVFNQAANDNHKTMALREKVARKAVAEVYHRRIHSNPHKVQMNGELAELAAAYKIEAQRLKAREATEKLQARKRWRDLAEERNDAWQTFRDKYRLAEKPHETPQQTKKKESDSRKAARALLQDFTSAGEPDIEKAKAVMWEKKGDEFRENAADIGEAKRLVGELLSDAAPASTPATKPEPAREQGWKLRGKDRAPRAPRNRRGGYDR